MNYLKSMRCQIISIGNELLIGDTVNTNASWIGQFLAEHGFEVTRIQTIGDNLKLLKTIIRQALAESAVVITTGGLGPTHDDLTKKAVTELFNCDTVLHKPTLEFIKKVFKKRNIPFSESNYDQAVVPDCCEVLFNKQGTAPGLWFDRGTSKLAVLPGVPFEMKHLMKSKVLPRIKELAVDHEQRYSKYILTAGIGESTLSDEVIGSLDSFLNEKVDVAYLPGLQGVRIRISGYGSTRKEAEENIEPVTDHILNKAGDVVVGEGKELTLAEAVGKLLKKHNIRLSSAESCTGGLLANTITDIPGSSDYMEGGIIAYSNDLKVKYLDVDEHILEKYGAVSKEVALQMAKEVANRFQTEIGISTTGIAGPGGGTEEKPVGTVWIGFWSRQQHFALKALFTNDRLINKERSVAVALDIIRRNLSGIAEMPYGLKKHSA